MSFLDDIMSSVSHEATTEKWLDKMDEDIQGANTTRRVKNIQFLGEIAGMDGSKPEH